jgi:dolichol-phosphate mannosyltransferase
MRSLIAIPVFNEARHLDDVLDEVLSLNDHVLVVDDGSTDETGGLLDRRDDIEVIRHPANRGYGKSLIDAFAFARRRRFDWLITMDCDRQHEPAQIAQFLEVAGCCDCDLVSGSRYRVELPRNDPAPADRRAINQAMTRLLNDLLGLRLTDSFCGYKAHRVAALDWLTLTETGYAFPMQFWVQAARASLRMRELPVRVIYNDPNRSFGARLDDPAIRLQHYTDVLLTELIRPAQSPWQMMRLAGLAPPADLPVAATVHTALDRNAASGSNTCHE